MGDLIFVFLCIFIFFILLNAFIHVLTIEKTYIQNNIKENKNISRIIV